MEKGGNGKGRENGKGGGNERGVQKKTENRIALISAYLVPNSMPLPRQ